MGNIKHTHTHTHTHTGILVKLHGYLFLQFRRRRPDPHRNRENSIRSINLIGSTHLKQFAGTLRSCEGGLYGGPKGSNTNQFPKTQTNHRKHKSNSENTNQIPKTQANFQKHKPVSRNTNQFPKTQTKISKHKPKSQNTNQNSRERPGKESTSFSPRGAYMPLYMKYSELKKTPAKQCFATIVDENKRKNSFIVLIAVLS